MAVLIDTSVVPSGERADYWAAMARRALHPLRIHTVDGASFSARMWSEQLGSIGLVRISATASTMSRSAREIAAADPECLHLHLMLRGRLDGVQQERLATLEPGDMAVYDTSRSAILRAEAPFEVLVLRIPKSALGRQAPMVARLASVRIAGGSGLPRLAGRVFCATVGGLAGGSIAPDDLGAQRHVLDVVRRLYADLAAAPDLERPYSTAELLLRAKAEIETRLGDPGLGPEQVARACFISTRYLHRVFEREGTSVCEFIRTARLERCRRDLLDPALAREPIHAIAGRWGLVSAAHFSRLFRDAYGCCPRECRSGRGIINQRGAALAAATDRE